MPETQEVLQQVLAGRYRVERELGRGGMATVFLAEDLKHGRQVAIKVLEPEVASALGAERFLREIKTAAQLAHPHILPLFDSGEGGGLLYYVMPYVSGESLRHRLQREPQLPVAEVQRIAEQVADALDYAHAHGVVHRDIKPENILLEGTQAIVADFGIARAVAGAGKLTTVGITVGTPAYMSPEQASGDAVDARSDVYSLGCVVYELLAGQTPYTGPTGAALIRQHLSAPVPDVAQLRPGVGAGTSAVLKRALAKSPEERYATATAMVRALAVGAGAGRGVPPDASTSEVTADVPAVAGTTASGAGRNAGRRARWVFVALATAALALAAVAAWQSWWPFGRATAPTPTKKDWILVAEFEGPPGDSTLAPAARSLLSAALDQSKMVATLSREQIEQALQAAGKSAATRLTPTVAKELAYRSAVRAVLEGTIGRLGTSYSIVLRLVDADTARVLFTGSATAKGDDALIPALGQLAKDLRHALHENRASLAATRPMTQAATPSFEAYRLYVAAQDRQGAYDIPGAMALYRRALALDPDFAMAWANMAHCHWQSWAPDSHRICLVEALRRPERMTSVQRQLVEMRLLNIDWDHARAVAVAEQALREDPNNLELLQGSYHTLTGSGRFEQVLEWTRRAKALSPFGPTDEVRANELVTLVCLGRLDEAREVLRHCDQVTRMFGLVWLAFATRRYAEAESIGIAYRGGPASPAPVDAFNMEGYIASARAARGAVQAAAGVEEQAVAMLDARAGTLVPEARVIYRSMFLRDLISLSVMTRGAIPLPPGTWARDNSTASLVSRALRAAFGGDRAEAQRLLAEVRARPEGDVEKRGFAPVLVEAQIELLAGRPKRAVELLQPLGARRVEAGGPLGVGLPWLRWTLADAYEQVGLPDSAAAHLERTRPFEWGTAIVGWQLPYIHQRLALLYARTGHVADAERHLAAVARAWDRPDPAIRKLLDETRAAVRAARERAHARPAP